jgi:dihydrodipicolinate synthase/N-acetylneuraminate lyase
LSRFEKLRSQTLRRAAPATAGSDRLTFALAGYVPHPGLSIPVVTILDRDGKVIEDEQRALVRFAIQGGLGADIIFAAGTTGEWDRLDNPRRQLAVRIAVEECRAFSGAGKTIEAWAGITAHTRAETLDNLVHALDISADAAVVAPLSIADVDDPTEFVARDIGLLFEKQGRAMPVFLYDNAEIAAPGKALHLHTRDVKSMSRLEYVRGVKVTASKSVLGNYTRAATHFKKRHEFAIYTGNPYLIFDIFVSPDGFAGRVRHYWNRYWTQDSLPYGVVAGPGNVMPREWQRAWQVCHAGDIELMARYGREMEAFRSVCQFSRGGRPYRATIACLKTALVELGACASDAIGTGTAGLEEAEKREFLRRFRELRRHAAVTLEPEWLSGGERPMAPARAYQDG